MTVFKQFKRQFESAYPTRRVRQSSVVFGNSQAALTSENKIVKELILPQSKEDENKFE